MKKFIAGLVLGLLLATSGIALASTDMIRIFVDGQEVIADVSPQIINGRVMVPARFIAEPLGATVTWDAVTRSVHITSANTQKPVQSKDTVTLPVQPVNDSDWLTAREVVNLTGWQYAPDGHFIRDNTVLFHYTEVKHKTVNHLLYIHRSVIDQYQ